LIPNLALLFVEVFLAVLLLLKLLLQQLELLLLKPLLIISAQTQGIPHLAGTRVGWLCTDRPSTNDQERCERGLLDHCAAP
jgi:hypothetical protein